MTLLQLEFRFAQRYLSNVPTFVVYVAQHGEYIYHWIPNSASLYVHKSGNRGRYLTLSPAVAMVMFIKYP